MGSRPMRPPLFTNNSFVRPPSLCFRGDARSSHHCDHALGVAWVFHCIFSSTLAAKAIAFIVASSTSSGKSGCVLCKAIAHVTKFQCTDIGPATDDVARVRGPPWADAHGRTHTFVLMVGLLLCVRSTQHESLPHGLVLVGPHIVNKSWRHDSLGIALVRSKAIVVSAT